MRLVGLMLLTLIVSASAPAQERTLAGKWKITSSAIDGQIISRKGNTLGFPDRLMIFEQLGDLRTCFVDREDVGSDVKPLGVWRINGNRFSAAFHLWCPDAEQPCGSVIMRGEFIDEDHIRGTATVFWDEEDETRPTGLDTWVFSFRGQRIRGGSEQ
jgi:hypothetical protein